MGDESLPKENLQFVSTHNKDTIKKLESQLDYVNKENHNLQNQIKDIRVKTRNAQAQF